jgi:hypothetical protein
LQKQPKTESVGHAIIAEPPAPDGPEQPFRLYGQVTVRFTRVCGAKPNTVMTMADHVFHLAAEAGVSVLYRSQIKDVDKY